MAALAGDSDADGCGVARTASAGALGTASALGVADWLEGSGVATSTGSECEAAGPEGARWREQANAAPLTTTARNSLLPRPCTPSNASTGHRTTSMLRSMRAGILTPVLALVVWSFVMWGWLYATRLPAMRRARIDPRMIKRKSDIDALPTKVQQVADNYNHLHEQPTVFYALAFYSYLVGVVDPLAVGLAWAYVGLRVLHSLVQATVNFVPLRFVVFALSTFVLIAIAARNLLALAGHK